MSDGSQARKRAVNLTVPEDLLEEARAAGTNVSAVLERALREELRERRWQRWREDNKKAVEASNAELAMNGMWYVPVWLES